MATRIVKVTGIAEWAKVFAQNRDLYGYKPTEKAEGSYEKYNGACTINMILDDAEIAKLQAAKFPRIAKPDPEGRGVVVRLLLLSLMALFGITIMTVPLVMAL